MSSVMHLPLLRDQTQMLFFQLAGLNLLWEAEVACVLERCPCRALCAPPPGSKSMWNTRSQVSLVQHGSGYLPITTTVTPRVNRRGPEQLPQKEAFNLPSRQLTMTFALSHLFSTPLLGCLWEWLWSHPTEWTKAKQTEQEPGVIRNKETDTLGVSRSLVTGNWF